MAGSPWWVLVALPSRYSTGFPARGVLQYAHSIRQAPARDEALRGEGGGLKEGVRTRGGGRHRLGPVLSFQPCPTNRDAAATPVPGALMTPAPSVVSGEQSLRKDGLILKGAKAQSCYFCCPLDSPMSFRIFCRKVNGL